MAYLGKTPSQAVRNRFYFTASGGETSLAPAQVTGLSFTDANYVDVSLNGVALVSGTDYTATPSTNTISGLSALTASDVVEIVVYDVFSVFGGNVKGDFTISNGTLAAEAVTVTGLTTTGNINFGDNDKAVFGAGDDLQIYHNGSHSLIQETGTGNLYIASDTNVIISNSATSETKAVFATDGAVNLYFDNVAKLGTKSDGVDIAGELQADSLDIDGAADISGTVTIGNKLDLNGQLDLDVAVATNPALSVTHTGTGNSTLAIFTQAASNTFNMAEWRTSNATGVLFFGANGNVSNTNNSYGAISDIKLKENIADASSQWDDIKAVKIRKYSFKSESSKTANQIGVVAQELEASGMNGLVVDNIDRHPDTFEDLGTITKEVKYSVLYMKALKALQEAMTRIETLETNQAALEARIATLENAQ